MGHAAVELANRSFNDAPARLFRLLATVPGPEVAEIAAQAAAGLTGQPVDTRPKHGRADATDHKGYRLLLTSALAIAVMALALFRPFIVGTARLVLSTAQVKIGDTYSATASGFSPGETVRFFWTGPSDA
ncbi:MAG: hypothetical protein ACRDR6_05910 [Pseudonocardiaceae bacterium]